MKLPKALVVLGIALDLQLEEGELRKRIAWRRRHVLCADESKDTLYILPELRKRAGDVDEGDLSKLRNVYRLWSGFESKRAQRGTVKLGEARLRGRARAIGYRSDKWTGKQTDYQHDFDHPPRVTQHGEVYRIKGAHLRVTPRGVVG